MTALSRAFAILGRFDVCVDEIIALEEKRHVMSFRAGISKEADIDSGERLFTSDGYGEAAEQAPGKYSIGPYPALCGGRSSAHNGGVERRQP